MACHSTDVFPLPSRLDIQVEYSWSWSYNIESKVGQGLDHSSWLRCFSTTFDRRSETLRQLKFEQADNLWTSTECSAFLPPRHCPNACNLCALERRPPGPVRPRSQPTQLSTTAMAQTRSTSYADSTAPARMFLIDFSSNRSLSCDRTTTKISDEKPIAS